MAGIPQAWRAYAEKQQILNARASVDPVAWGLEAGLGGLLDGATAATVDRTIASAARRSRYGRGLIARYIRIGEPLDCGPQLEARSLLAMLEARLPTIHLAALMGDLGAAPPLPKGAAARTRLSRARSAARRLAA